MSDTLDRKVSGMSPKGLLQACMAGCAVLLILTVWAYYAEPIATADSTFWNDQLVTFLTLLPAVGAAVAGTLVTRQFGRDEGPHRVWQAFSIGLWLWVAGEAGGFVYNAIYIDGTYPDFSLIDLCWLAGYFYLGLSLYYQVRLVYGAQRRGRRIYLGLVALALLVTAGLTDLAAGAGLGGESKWIILFVSVLYPIFDLAEGSIAIWLSFLFGRGQWSRPWWGLILFALADGIDTFYWLGGYEYLSPAVQTALDFVSVTAYPASYMVAGLALLSNYLILHYGADSGLLKVSRKEQAEIPEK